MRERMGCPCRTEEPADAAPCADTCEVALQEVEGEACLEPYEDTSYQPQGGKGAAARAVGH